MDVHMKMKTLYPLLVMVGLALPSVLGCSGDFAQVGSSCLKVVIAADGGFSSGNFPVSWQEAKGKCQALGAGLAIIDTKEKRLAINQYLEVEFKSFAGYPYWVGGTYEDGTWRWTNGKVIDLTKDLWLRNQPDGGAKKAHTLLVPVDEGYYLAQRSADGYAPAYICQSS